MQPRINLVEEPAFRLGALDVRPSTRELVTAQERQTLEPRVMQVLVALAKADGQTVTRDQLVASCWDGRIVGDDALNRVISVLRRTEERFGRGAFVIETVPKAGYRLMRQGGEPGNRPTLALMPFEDRSEARRDSALAVGIVEDLASALLRYSFVRVLAPSLTRSGEAPPDSVAIGRKVGAGYALEGSIKRSGEDLRVAMRLVETQAGGLMWSIELTRPISDLAALQEALVTELAAQLGVQLHHAEMTRALKKPSDVTAYESLLRALAHWYNLSFANFPLLVSEARRAVGITPEYAAAHGVLSYALALQGVWIAPADPELKAEAFHHADRAVAIDPNDAMALAFAAGAYLCLGKPIDASRYASRAVELNPSLPIAQQQLGLACLRLGRNDEAVTCFDVVERLSPGHVSLHLTYLRRAHAFEQGGHHQRAMVDMEKAFRANSHYGPTLVLRAGLCMLAQRGEEASDAVERLRALEPSTTVESHAERASVWLHPQQSEALLAAFRAAWAATS